jgi:hypothetical protein
LPSAATAAIIKFSAVLKQVAGRVMPDGILCCRVKPTGLHRCHCMNNTTIGTITRRNASLNVGTGV